MTAARPRLLFIAFYFPPTRASGVFRARAIANHLAEAGWDVTVMTAPRAFFTQHIQSVDATLEATVHPDVRVERVHFPPGPFTRDVRSFPWTRAMFPKLDGKVREALRRRTFPDPYAAWIPRAVRAGWRLHRQQPFDLVMATGNPFSSFEIARLLGRMLGVPHVLDYRDAWTLDQFAEAPAFPPDHPAWDAERKLMRSASQIVFVNEPQLEWHAERYPEAAARMVVVENGYDEELLRSSLERPVTAPDGGLQYGYIGTITRHLPIDEFADGWRLAVSSGELTDAEAILYGYLGFFRHSAKGLEAGLPFEDDLGIRYGGSLPKEEVGPTFADLDVLLLITPSSRFITCQKVYEYMAFGKPIVSINEPGTDAREPLRDYPLSFAVEELTASAVAEQLVAAGEAARHPDPEVVAEARHVAERHSRTAHLRPLDRTLRELVAHG